MQALPHIVHTQAYIVIIEGYDCVLVSGVIVRELELMLEAASSNPSLDENTVSAI